MTIPKPITTPTEFADRSAVWGILYPAFAGSTARYNASKIAALRDAEVGGHLRQIIVQIDDGALSDAIDALDALHASLTGTAASTVTKSNQGPVWSTMTHGESVARAPNVSGGVELRVFDGGIHRGGFKAVVTIRGGGLSGSTTYHPDLADVQGEAVAMARDLCRQEIDRLKQILAWLGTDDADEGAA